MNSRQSISSDYNIPYRIFLHHLKNITTHCHNSYELLFLLEGTASVLINDKSYTLSEEDLLLVNPNQLHELHSPDGVMIVLQLKPDFFIEEMGTELLPYFNCYSYQAPNQEQFFNLRVLLAHLIKAESQQGKNSRLRSKSLIYSLVFELMSHFQSKEQRYTLPDKNMDRISKILSYINLNFKENLSLKLLSKQEFLSVSYLSRYIEKHLGVSFKTHLTQIRLTHAFNDLCTTDKTITQVASDNGFPSSRAFVTAFQNKFHCLPSDYRTQHNLPLLQESSDLDMPLEHKEVSRSSYLAKLSKYLDEETEIRTLDVIEMDLITIPPVDTRKSQHRLSPSFKQILALGRASEIKEKKVQDMLRVLQAEIGFQFIQIDDLFEQDIIDYFHGNSQVKSFNYDTIDEIIDFLLSINFKPLMKIGLDYKNSRLITQMIRSKEDLREYRSRWIFIVHSFFDHLKEKYGINEIKTWLFILQEEVNDHYLTLVKEHEKRYYQFYYDTYHSIKSVDPTIPFGPTPALPYMLENENLLTSLIHFFTTNDCIPDFFSFKYYPVTYQDSNSGNTVLLRTETDGLERFITKYKEQLAQNGMAHLPIYITQWNSTTSNTDLLNDTCFKSAYLIKNIVDNYDRVAAFGYWLLSDYNSVHQCGPELFHGGLGLFTKNGIKKTAYNAFWLLNKLGSHLLIKGDGYLISKDRHDIQMLLYNYHHYNRLYAMGEVYDMTHYNRYTPFITEYTREYTLELTHLTGKTYAVTEYILNKDNGSSYDLWLKTFAHGLETKESLDYLKYRSSPTIKCSKLDAQNGIIKLNYSLEPHEVRLITLINLCK